MKRRKSVVTALLLSVMAVFTSGCLYPDDQLAQNQKPAKDAILNVQTIIDQYQKDTGLLPIMNSDVKTPLYEKFRIDFDKLVRMKYLSDIPVTAYEKGGSYYYLIINEETDPTVKLMNLVIYQKVNDIQSLVKTYAGNHGGELPAAKELYPGLFLIDFGKFDAKEPEIFSMFSGQTLPLMMDANGTVYIDYAIDIMQALQKSGTAKPDAAQDLRSYLVNGSDFVPVKSTVYRLVNGEPQAAIE